MARFSFCYVVTRMCGRYTLKTGRKKLAEQFHLDELPELSPRYNLGPTQDGLVVRTGDAPGTRTAAFLRWGLIPAWSKAGVSAPLLINVRGETAVSRPAFREAMKRRRCLVIADGFFEWSRHGTLKQPYYLTVHRGEPFAMAGVWERWRPPGSEEPVETYAILTTTANEVLAPLHDRMPVILPEEFHEDWLNPMLTDGHALQPLLKPYPAVHMFARAVNPRVNNIRNDDPTCLDSIPESHGTDSAARAPGSPAGSPSNGQLDLDFGN